MQELQPPTKSILAENGNACKLPLNLLRSFKGKISVAGCFCCCVSATLLCSFASKVGCFSSSKSSSSFSPPQPQLPLWPVCLLRPSGCFCLIGNNSVICCQRSPMVIALGAAASTALVRHHLTHPRTCSSRATFVMSAVAGAAVALLVRFSPGASIHSCGKAKLLLEQHIPLGLFCRICLSCLWPVCLLRSSTDGLSVLNFRLLRLSLPTKRHVILYAFKWPCSGKVTSMGSLLISKYVFSSG